MKAPFKKGDKVVKKSGNSFKSGARIAKVTKVEPAKAHGKFKVYTDETIGFLFNTELILAKTGEEPKVQTGTIQTDKVSAGTTSSDAPIKNFVDATNLQHFAPPVEQRPESDHYHTGSVDVWQFADENFSHDELIGFHRINAIKYLARYGKKAGYNRRDLEKAIVSIKKLIELGESK